MFHDGREYCLHMFWNDRIASMDQGPGTRGAQQSDGRSRRESGIQSRSAARVRDQRLNVIKQRGGDMDIEHALLQLLEALWRRNGVERLYKIAPIDAAQQLALCGGGRIA